MCEVKIVSLAGWLIARIPEEISKSLPSKGMLMISGTIDGLGFQAPLEPDGRASHWFRLSVELIQAGKLRAGNTVRLAFSPLSDWPEPFIPQDMENALSGDSLCFQAWKKLTTKARWEWIRWIRSTSNQATRNKRITAALDKLRKGMKRPCCFNSSTCTIPLVSKAGVLLEGDDRQSGI